MRLLVRIHFVIMIIRRTGLAGARERAVPADAGRVPLHARGRQGRGCRRTGAPSFHLESDTKRRELVALPRSG